MWSSAYFFEVTVHHILAELYSSVNVLSLANSSYSLHLIKLKLDLKLDHDVEQWVLFGGHMPPNSSRVMPPLKFL